MAKFLLVYQGGASGMAASPAEQKAIMDDWTSWFTRLGSALVDAGNPTLPSARLVGSDGKVGDVPAAAVVSGYSLVNAASLDAAVGLAKGCPHLMAGGTVSVFETINVM